MRKIPLAIICMAYPSVAFLQPAPAELPPPITFIAQIDKIEVNKTAIGKEMKLLLADRFYFKSKTPCQRDTLSARPQSFGLTPKAYVEKIRSLVPAMLDERYFYLTIDQCDGEGTSMLTGMELCTEALCGAEYMKKSPYLWLNEKITRTVKRRAESFVELPLPYDKDKKLWKVVGWYIEEQADNTQPLPHTHKAFAGYTDDEAFKSQKFIGEMTSWYRSGNVSSTATYNKEGKLQGRYDTYFDEEGKKAETAEFSHGLMNGEYSVFYQNGAIESQRQFVDNKIVDGECPHYYEDGRLKQQHSYLNQQLEGPAYEYFPDGKVKEKNVYRQGKVVGESMTYYPSGQVRFISHKNDNGNDDGVTEEYSNEGKLISTATYKDGKQLAKKNWYENGQLKQEVLFDNAGRREGVSREWFANGKLYTAVSYKQGIKEGRSEEWQENGQPKSLFMYKNGKLDGEYQYWNERGKLLYSTQYKDDKKNGPDRRWSEDTGKMIEETIYVDDVRNGMNKTFNDRTGKLLTAVPYVDDERNGTEETYGPDGVKVIRCYRKNEQLAVLYDPVATSHLANQGEAAAQYKLGKYHITCSDYAAGLAWLEKSAKQDNAAALLLLAQSYDEGYGVEKDKKQYLDYLLKAATLGNDEAQLEIGYLYLTGNGVAKNLPEAYQWYVKSAAQGNPRANYHLGLMYQNGDGVEKNAEKAKQYFIIAAQGGMKEAFEALRPYKNMDNRN
ncbi:hypothetical protein [Klebsiella variicola]|uniref:hypothetical protein n=1 Tax=Klebsiella variicola TaxID=244366 RepID=UPI001E62411E|nr:hypothetical protein [Klebsiella variicola]